MQLKFGGQFIHRLKGTKNKVFWTILSWLFWGLILNKSLCNSHCNHYSFAFELWPKMPLTNHIVSLVSQDIIKRWSWFSTCDHTFLDPTNHFNHLAFVHQESTDFQMTVIMLLMVIIMMIIVIIMLITMMKMMLILWWSWYSQDQGI